jgi:WD40 repeat protein
MKGYDVTTVDPFQQQSHLSSSKPVTPLLLETQSAAVQNVTFHAHKPYVAACLINGIVQVWNYETRQLLRRMGHHSFLPVRGVDLHRSESLLVSGGDDCSIKVWNYDSCDAEQQGPYIAAPTKSTASDPSCLCTLLGHLDRVRTVQFHSTAPWIVSASEDQNVIIWDFRQGTSLVLTGHNHHITSASFHPTKQLLVSSSWDQTVRVWDIHGLEGRLRQSQAGAFWGFPCVKFVLEGHRGGVHWACFHPTVPQLLISAGDDGQVKTWQMSETKAWEVDNLSHDNAIRCVFHPMTVDLELVVALEADQSILRVWNHSVQETNRPLRGHPAVPMRTFGPSVFGHRRFSSLARCEYRQNLFAVGHESGMFLFRIEVNNDDDDVNCSKTTRGPIQSISLVLQSFDATTPIEQDTESPHQREKREERSRQYHRQKQPITSLSRIRLCIGLVVVWTIASLVKILLYPGSLVAVLFVSGAGLFLYFTCRSPEADVVDGGDERHPFLPLSADKDERRGDVGQMELV